MKQLFIITGANGHLGTTIIRKLSKKNKKVRGFVLPGEKTREYRQVDYVAGDICEKETMRPLFQNTQGMQVIVIHTAGIVDIADKVTDKMYEVNVNGTKNMLELCMEYQVSRLVYVSSVHAIPEKSKLQVMNETLEFSPDKVEGGYAKTKAEATKLVLEASKQGLDVVVVHPSGILGPFDSSGNHLVQLVKDYIQGRLPACVHGGYDFVDVRDVAQGCLAAVAKGKSGECYILSNRHYEVKDVLNMIKSIRGGKKIPMLPMWCARAGEPILKSYAKWKKRRPLYTKYSLYTLTSNDKFSHDKATKELDYHPRDLYDTLKDTIHWLGKKKVSAIK